MNSLPSRFRRVSAAFVALVVALPAAVLAASAVPAASATPNPRSPFGPTASSPAARSATAAVQIEARLAGKVVDLRGDPIPGVIVRIRYVDMGQEVVTETDEDGDYFRRGLRTGRYRIRFEKDGYVTEEADTRLGNGVNTIDVTLTPTEVERARQMREAADQAYATGYEAFRAGDYETAITEMEEVLASLSDEDPGAPEARQRAYLIMARSYMELDRPEKALERYEALVELQSEDAGIRTELGRAYVQTDQLDKAAEQFRAALELNPENPDIQYNVGVIMFQAGKVEEAVAALQKAVELQPEFPLARKSLGYAQTRVGDYRAAVENLQVYLDQQPEAPDAAEIQGLVDSLKLEIARQDAAKQEEGEGDEVEGSR